MTTLSSSPAPVSALELVALATAAMPSLQVRGIKGDLVDSESGQWLSFVDVSGEQWLAWAPSFNFTESGFRKFERVLDLLTSAHIVRRVPFEVAKPVGSLSRKGDGAVLVLTHPGGYPLCSADLEKAGLLPQSLGSALAALHELDPTTYAAATGQFADAQMTRKALRRLVDLHAAAIPSRLRLRWLDAIDEDALWNFIPVPLHGSLSPEYIYAAPGGAVVGITRFDRAAVGDPAQDLMWLMLYASDDFLKAFETSYCSTRPTTDLHVLTRAQLLSELETLRWYARAVYADDQEWRREGMRALWDLDAELGDYRLVASRRQVVEIKFTVEEEPLLKLQSEGQSARSARPTPSSPPRSTPDAVETELIATVEKAGPFTPSRQDGPPSWSADA